MSEYPPGGKVVIDIGDPDGIDARFRSGKHQVRLGRRYDDKSTVALVEFFTDEELRELFRKCGDRLWGSNSWQVTINFRCPGCRANDHDAEEHH